MINLSSIYVRATCIGSARDQLVGLRDVGQQLLSKNKRRVGKRLQDHIETAHGYATTQLEPDGAPGLGDSLATDFCRASGMLYITH